MLLALDPDQTLFRETTEKLLDELVPVSELRRLRHDPDGFDQEYWRRGADLGWTALLVSEEQGGGSISALGLVDLGLVAYEFGRHAAPGPLAVTNVVAATLSERGGPEHRDAIGELLSGQSIATWCLGVPSSHGGAGARMVEVRAEGNDVVLNGLTRPVESAARAAYLLVTGRTGSGVTQVLIPAGAEGMRVEPMHSVDMTRRFSVVTFDEVRVPASAVVGEIGSAADQVERQVARAVVIHNVEAVGTMQAAFDMTMQWAFDRYSFGRPLVSYQELKHRFADMKTWLEASHAISDEATEAVALGSAAADELASASKSFIGAYGAELMQDCVQIHGGIGLTFDHDIHLYLRRHTTNRALWGTPADHRRRLADMVEQMEEATL
jgi:alkylation response protein AidB-like acyl-CoA dehydrogenase